MPSLNTRRQTPDHRKRLSSLAFVKQSVASLKREAEVDSFGPTALELSPRRPEPAHDIIQELS